MGKHPDWQSKAKPTDPHAGTVVPRCGVQDSREASRCQTQKLNSMSIPPALPKSQLMPRGASETLPHHAHGILAQPKTTESHSFHLHMLRTICGSLLVFLIFGEDEANRRNRLIIRTNFEHHIGAMVLSNPLPFHRPHLFVPHEAKAAHPYGGVMPETSSHE